MQNNELRNNLRKMYNTNRDKLHNEISRLGSLEQRNTTYRRNGTLNFGATQMINLIDKDYYTFGFGGDGPVGS